MGMVFMGATYFGIGLWSTQHARVWSEVVLGLLSIGSGVEMLLNDEPSLRTLWVRMAVGWIVAIAATILM
jgi:hypothetical protein